MGLIYLYLYLYMSVAAVHKTHNAVHFRSPHNSTSRHTAMCCYCGMLHGTVLLVLTCATGWTELTAERRMLHIHTKCRGADKSLASLGRK